MEIVYIEDKNKLNDFLVRQDVKSGLFLQSWDWGEFQKEAGHKIFRLAAVEGEEILAVALVIKHGLPAGKSYLYCPRGPVFPHNTEHITHNKEIWKLLINEIRKIAKKENSIFFRFEPDQDIKETLNAIRYTLYATKSVQPKDTLILGINKSEEELLAGMHPKTRYNIRLAEKKGVTVRIANQKRDTEEFLNLMRQTAGRDGFKLHPDDYYRKMIEVFKIHNSKFIIQNSSPKASLYFAEYEGKVIASNLVIFFGDTATYLHGASSSQDRNVMAPYLLHWRIIQDAKKMGYKYYDWWGISSKIKNWEGITRFKKGFGGEEVNYPGAFDLAFQPFWHKIYKTIKKFK